MCKKYQFISVYKKYVSFICIKIKLVQENIKKNTLILIVIYFLQKIPTWNCTVIQYTMDLN